MIIVDASCAIEVLLGTDAAASIEARWRTGRGLHAPELIDLEVLQVLRRLVTGREISGERAMLAVDAFARLALRRWSHGPLRQRVWSLRANLSAYDAAYVALGEHLRCPVLTRDARLARSAGHRARVEVV